MNVKLVILYWLYYIYIYKTDLYIDLPIYNIIKIKIFCLDNTNNQTITVKQTSDLIKAIVNQNYSMLYILNTLKAKLNSICHLLASLGAHHILHVSRVRVKPTKGIALGAPV